MNGALFATERDKSTMPEFVLPRVPPKSPDEALASFEVATGFRIELVAAEPLVVDPVAMAFDEQGRLYVVEMRDYSEQDKERLGRVRLLTDEDGDGRFDRSSVFVDGLSWPTAVACYDGGVFIGNAPDILYCKDTDGDGVADERRVVFTGFGRGNVQGLLNSFQWGLDHRIYGATSSAGGKITRDVSEAAGANSDKAVSARLPDLRHWNCAAAISRSIRRRSRSRRSPAAASMGCASIAGATGSFATTAITCRRSCSRSAIWRAIRFSRWSRRGDRLPPTGRKRPCIASARSKRGGSPARSCAWPAWRPGPIEGGGQPAGYFTSATGVTVYEGGCGARTRCRRRGQSEARTEVAQPLGLCRGRRQQSHPSQAARARRRDLSRRASRQGNRVRALDATSGFAPCKWRSGPEGALYVADMYREVIEHPASLPPQLKRQLDLTSGRPRADLSHRARAITSTRSTAAAGRRDHATAGRIAGSCEQWRRTTALRLLYERQDCGRRRSVAGESHGEQAAGRPHRRAVRAGKPQIAAAARLDRCLSDPHPQVRRHALRLAEPLLNSSAGAVSTKSLLLVDDADPVVQFQLALARRVRRPASRTSARRDNCSQRGAARHRGRGAHVDQHVRRPGAAVRSSRTAKWLASPHASSRVVGDCRANRAAAPRRGS